MTEAELVQIEQRVAAAHRELPHTAHYTIATDLKSAIAEVRRLRGLIQRAEWSAAWDAQDVTFYACPWCEADRGDGHVPTCPAFPHGAEEARRAELRQRRDVGRPTYTPTA